jgi:hypothetical protein
MSENKSQLVAHRDSNKVSYAQLATIIPPNSTRYWRPVAHVELVDTLRSSLKERGLVITREEFAINPMGTKLFGTMDIEGDILPGAMAAALGFRHANDKSMALQSVAGGRVFVCDNLALSGDMTVLKHKHTWNFSLRGLINKGLDSWQRKQVQFTGSIERMINTPITDTAAQALLGKALYDGVTTFQTFKIAYDLYFTKAVMQPEAFPDCAPRTAWGLHNAYTRALKESQPNVAFNTTVDLGKLFQL